MKGAAIGGILAVAHSRRREQGGRPQKTAALVQGRRCFGSGRRTLERTFSLTVQESALDPQLCGPSYLLRTEYIVRMLTRGHPSSTLHEMCDRCCRPGVVYVIGQLTSHFCITISQ